MPATVISYLYDSIIIIVAYTHYSRYSAGSTLMVAGSIHVTRYNLTIFGCLLICVIFPQLLAILLL